MRVDSLAHEAVEEIHHFISLEEILFDDFYEIVYHVLQEIDLSLLRISVQETISELSQSLYSQQENIRILACIILFDRKQRVQLSHRVAEELREITELVQLFGKEGSEVVERVVDLGEDGMMEFLWDIVKSLNVVLHDPVFVLFVDFEFRVALWHVFEDAEEDIDEFSV